MTSDTYKGMIAIPVPGQYTRHWRGANTYLHMTLGFMPQVTPKQAEKLAMSALSVCRDFGPFPVEMRGQETFGEDTKVALVVISPRLSALRNVLITKALALFPNIVDLKTYPEWRPHVSFGSGDNVPNLATDGTFAVENLHISLKGGPLFEVPFSGIR